jgi:hypothetical protein
MSTIDPKLVTRCMEEFQRMDEEALIVLKGHLLIEERLNAILEKFVFHPEFVEEAHLRFQQKVLLARSLSLDEHKNRLWDLILALSALRNEMAHALASERRQKKTATLISIYGEIMASDAAPEEATAFVPHVRMAFAASLCIGFLIGFEQEVERFRTVVNALDRGLNPHRSQNPPNQPPQRNAGSRPFSGDSPASETPSSLGPRG